MSLVTAYCEGAEVEITSDGRSLPLYFDPEESHSEETTPHDSSIPKNYTYYVEALRDKMFTVKCTMTREFDMKSGNAVLVKTKPDGKGGWYKYVGKDEWIRNGKLFCQTMSYFPEYDPKTKKWRKAYFSFGHLDLREAGEIEPKPTLIEKLGCIEIEIKRTMAVPLRVPKITDESRYGKLDRISQVSEKVLKGRAISNSVDFVTGPKMSAPTNRHKFTPISGSDGKPICIQILYRSRATLQMLGCIPRSLSPEPSASPDPVQEIQELRARLKLLEGQADVKLEHANNAGSQANPISIKREGNASGTSRPSKRRRADEEIEIVDLTDV